MVTGQDSPPKGENLTVRVAQKIREDSRTTGKLVPLEVFYLEPFCLTPQEGEELLTDLTRSEDFADIEIMKDDERGKVYFYATPYICEAYAKTLLLAEKKDPSRLVAETVREESRLYPRPTCSLVFQLPPYELDPEELPAILKEIGKQKDLQDIKWFKASTDVLYLYSERHMTFEHARGLAEWAEVDQFELK